MLHIAIIFLLLFILELAYFKVADHFNIIDKPSERGSSKYITLRGGGIIFYLAALIWFFLSGFHFWLFFAGLSIVSILSFVDDVHSLSPRLRLPLQFVGILLLLCQLIMLFTNGIVFDTTTCLYVALFVVVGLIVCTGAMNVFNFMDGINGITGGYSLIVLLAILFTLNATDYFEGSEAVEWLNTLVIITLLADVVFCFFNFRTRAKCFAGDVGSVSIAFIILFSLGFIIVQTRDFSWLTFAVVYGVDGCLTIIHRLMLHEKISLPHRKHLFQIMANELHIPHVAVSLVYMCVQALCCAWYLACPGYLTMFLQVLVLSVVYVLFMKRFFHLHQG
ncbi:MAG: UDP-GlcNAc--UDP-phosphate GlcNAc-1-phosphate transferase [Prevotella sp.]|nr:UDP-GlcNAc--UDP-phosphate GlcNAc-1-phosphate transferase [Prevotella sp.]